MISEKITSYYVCLIVGGTLVRSRRIKVKTRKKRLIRAISIIQNHSPRPEYLIIATYTWLKLSPVKLTIDIARANSTLDPAELVTWDVREKLNSKTWDDSTYFGSTTSMRCMCWRVRVFLAFYSQIIMDKSSQRGVCRHVVLKPVARYDYVRKRLVNKRKRVISTVAVPCAVPPTYILRLAPPTPSLSTQTYRSPSLVSVHQSRKHIASLIHVSRYLPYLCPLKNNTTVPHNKEGTLYTVTENQQPQLQSALPLPPNSPYILSENKIIAHIMLSSV